VSDIEDEVREALRATADRVPLTFDAPAEVLRRARRRMARTLGAAILTVVLLAGGAVAGVRAFTAVPPSRPAPAATIPSHPSTPSTTSAPVASAPGTVRVVRRLPIAGAAAAAVGEQGLYVLWPSQPPHYRLGLVDPLSGRVVRSATGTGDPAGIAVTADSVWVLTTLFAKPTPGMRPGDEGVDRFDPSSLRARAHVPLAGHCAGASVLHAGGGGVWVNGETSVCQIDPAVNRLRREVSFPDDQVNTLDVADTTVLVTLTGSTQTGTPSLLATVEAASGKVRQTATIAPGPSYAGIAALADGDALVAISPAGAGGPVALLHVVAGKVVATQPRVGGSLLVASPSRGGWSAQPSGTTLWSVGADGRARGSVGHLPRIVGLAADSTGGVYAVTETSIVVVAFQPR
jgi:hypothetical protein